VSNKSKVRGNSLENASLLLERCLFFTSSLVLFSLCKLIPGEIADYLYSFMVLGFAGCLILSRSVRDTCNIWINRLISWNSVTKLKVYGFIVVLSLEYQALNRFMLEISNDNFEMWNLTLDKLLAVARFSILFLLLGISNQIFANFLNKGKKILTTTSVLTLAFLIFLIHSVKTPNSLPDYYHTEFMGDELLSRKANLRNYKNYIGQYSNLISVFVAFLPKQFLTVRANVDWISIVLQVINVVILFILIKKLSQSSRLAFMFAFVILAAPFFGGASAIDWLQNLPSRSFFLTLAILVFVYFLFICGLIISLTLLNDLLTGLQLWLSLLATLFVYRHGLTKKTSIGMVSLIFLTCLPVLWFLLGSDLPKELLYIYYTSYGQNGFGKEFEFLGYDVIFWGFALAALNLAVENAKTRSGHFEKNRNILILFFSLLELSTIPYCTGRSYTAQIWASGAIYLILLFSLLANESTHQDLIKAEKEIKSKSVIPNISHSLFLIVFLVSMYSNFWYPTSTLYELQRITSGTNSVESLFYSRANHNVYQENAFKAIRYMLQEHEASSVGLLLPRGNLLAMRFGIENSLIVNHPDSLIFQTQIRALCGTLLLHPKRNYVIDYDLYVRMQNNEECRLLLTRSNFVERYGSEVVALIGIR
jgi:hypothetical protein